MPAQENNKNQKSAGPSIVEDFLNYFDIDLADTPEMKRAIFNIRYRVYCEEFGYEEGANFPDGAETDEFDDQSVHCLITHKSSGMPAGCVRLVTVEGEQVMPMEKYCRDSLDHEFIDSLSVPRAEICEFSRLAVDGAFRRRSGENLTRFGEISSLDCTRREIRTFPLIAISAFIAAFATSELIGRPNCFAMMEPFLPRMLRRSGINVLSAGEEVDYHGMRAAYFITTDSAMEGTTEDLRELFQEIRRRFKGQIEQRELHNVATVRSMDYFRRQRSTDKGSHRNGLFDPRSFPVAV